MKPPVLWNRLEDASSVGNSVIGVNGTIYGSNVSYDSVKFGNGAKSTQAGTSRIEFVGINIPFDYGTIEFWSKLIQSPGSATAHVNWFSSDDNSYPRLEFHWDCNLNLGNVWIAYGGPSSQRRRFHSWNASDIGWTSAGDIIHFAVVWDMDESDADCLRLYSNGTRVSGSGITEGTGNKTTMKGTTLDDLAILTLRNFTSSDRISNCNIDNIKYYDYAKTDFSDRHKERSGMNDHVVII